MSKINTDYINNLNKLTSEVLENESISKTTRILIETLVSTVNFLYEENKDLKVRIVKLENEVEDLKKQLNKNSSNSHLPPSMDRYKKKPKDIRTKNKKKKTGGQPGHKGVTLEMTSTPDEVIKYKLKGKCRFCGDVLSELKNKSISKRQEFNIEFKAVVTEHQNESGACRCGIKHGTSFPDHIKAPVQYGASVQSFIGYLSHYQLLPSERIKDFYNDYFKLPMSEGTVANVLARLHVNLNSFEKESKKALLNSKVLNADETPMKVNGKDHYLHTISTNELTLICAHESRGKQAINSIGVLPNFRGFLVSDFFKMYYALRVKNVACHSHLDRELNGVIEFEKKKWAKKLKKYFQKLNKEINKLKKRGKQIEFGKQIEYETEYDKIIEEAKLESPGFDRVGKKTDGENLLRRFVYYKDAVIRFTKDIEIPFTNNLSERDLRMSKTKQKISGCFRTPQGLTQFARGRSYISTVKKQGRSIKIALEHAMKQPNPNYIELFT